jgi:hypothetical protein
MDPGTWDGLVLPMLAVGFGLFAVAGPVRCIALGKSTVDAEPGGSCWKLLSVADPKLLVALGEEAVAIGNVAEGGAV